MDLVARRKAPRLECLQYAYPNQGACRYKMESTALSVRESAAEFRVDDSIGMLTRIVRFDTSADEQDKVTEVMERSVKSGIYTSKERFGDPGSGPEGFVVWSRRAEMRRDRSWLACAAMRRRY